MWSGARGVADFMDVFAGERVFVQRPAEPGRLLVTNLGPRGSWMPVFSSLEGLARHVGECDYFSATGADLLELVPPGVGVMLDPDDTHRFPIVARMAPPEVVARAWADAVAARTAAGA